MTLTPRRIAAAVLALWGGTALLVAGRIGWALLVLLGAYLLWRRPGAAPAAPQAPAVPTVRAVPRSVTSAEPMPYWLLPTAAAAGAAAVLHDREQPAAADSEEPVEEDVCDESYDAIGYAGPAAAGWDGVDDADADADFGGFGGFGGGGGWGPEADFGGSGGGGDWDGGAGDDFGGFGGGGDWGGGDDW